MAITNPTESKPSTKPLESASKPGTYWRIVGLFVVILLLMIVLWQLDVQNGLRSGILLLGCSFVFLALPSFFLAFLLGRNFLIQGSPGSLLLGVGLTFLGTSSVVSPLFIDADPNVAVTIYNICLFCSALCHVSGVLVSSSARPLPAPWFWLSGIYILAFGIIGLIGLGASIESTPVFFVDGQGGTLVRQIVLGLTTALFLVTAMLLRSRERSSQFANGYAVALSLFAVGLYFSVFTPAHDSLIAWIARGSQYLGGCFLMLAGIGSVRESQRWEISLQTALRQSQERLRWAQVSAGIGLWEWNPSTSEQNFSPEYERVYGVVPGSIKTYADWRKRVHPEDIDRVEAERDTAVAARRPFELEFRILHGSGEVRWMSSKGGGLFDSSGKLALIMGVSVDITERKLAEQALQAAKLEAENEKRRLEAVFQALPVGVVITDEKGGAVRSNEMFRSIWGPYPAPQNIPEYQQFNAWWEDSGKPVEPSEWASAIAVREGKSVLGQLMKIERFDGAHRFVLNSAAPVKDPSGQIIGSAVAVQDITDFRKAQESLRQALQLVQFQTRYLEDLVRERTGKLEEAVADLEHFSYTITHDLRAPLRVMRGYGDLLLKYNNGLSDRSKDFISRICSASERMDKLITDALQYNSLVRQNFELGPVNCGLLLRGILQSYPQYQEADIAIEGEIPAVLGNEAVLTQCFSNLLNNAIKFVESGRRPRVRIRSEIRGEHVRIWIEDNGIGIPQDCQEQIFNMFQRLSTKYDGTGIGLALVRKAAERLNGEVGVESEPGHGSKFWLEFKQAPAENVL